MILALGRFGEFDGDRAWTQACRSKGSPRQRGRIVVASGWWKLSHRSESITLRSFLFCSAAGEVEMPYQILITKPRLAGLPVRVGEHPLP